MDILAEATFKYFKISVFSSYVVQFNLKLLTRIGIIFTTN